MITADIKLRSKRWTGHVARRGKNNKNRVLVRKTEGKDHLEDLGVDGRIILKGILRKYKDKAWIRPGHETVMSCCEHGNEHCSSINCRVYIDKEDCEEGLLHAVRLLVTSIQSIALAGYSQCLDAPQVVEGSVRQRLDIVVIQRPATDGQTGVTAITDWMSTST